MPQSPEYGKEFSYPNESQVAAVLELESGVTGNFALNGDSVIADQAQFLIYGTKGILKLTDPNQFGGKNMLLANSYDFANPPVWTEVENVFAHAETAVESDLPRWRRLFKRRQEQGKQRDGVSCAGYHR